MIIHPGLGKTGTTTIQNAFWQARKRLLETDALLFPSLGPNHSDAFIASFSTDASSRNAIEDGLRGYRADVRERCLKVLDRDLARPDWTTVVISAEDISTLSEGDLQDLKTWALTYVDSIRIYYWVRDPVSYATSFALQRLKGGHTLSVAVENYVVPRFRKTLGGAISVFGRDNVAMVDLESATQATGGIVGEFARHISLSRAGTEALISASEHNNQSFSLEAALMLSHINARRLTEAESDSTLAVQEFLPLLGIKGTRFTLPGNVRRQIRERSSEEVRWLNTMFDRHLYETESDTATDEPVDVNMDFIESTALVLSELMNNAKATSLVLTALEAIRRGKIDTVSVSLAQAQSLAPNSPIVRQQIRHIERTHSIKPAAIPPRGLGLLRRLIRAEEESTD